MLTEEQALQDEPVEQGQIPTSEQIGNQQRRLKSAVVLANVPSVEQVRVETIGDRAKGLKSMALSSLYQNPDLYQAATLELFMQAIALACQQDGEYQQAIREESRPNGAIRQTIREESRPNGAIRQTIRQECQQAITEECKPEKAISQLFRIECQEGGSIRTAMKEVIQTECREYGAITGATRQGIKVECGVNGAITGAIRQGFQVECRVNGAITEAISRSNNISEQRFLIRNDNKLRRLNEAPLLSLMNVNGEEPQIFLALFRTFGRWEINPLTT